MTESIATPSSAAAPTPAPAGPTVLGQNQYGKAEVRVVRVVREGDVHHIKDLNVSIALSGAMQDVHYSGSNANCLPTDTTKNTVYAFAKEHGITSPEEFGIRLARHFVGSQESVHRARIRIEEYAWDRILTPGAEGPAHSFSRRGGETRVTEVTHEDGHWQVISGLKGLTVLNSTDSEFWGYVKDQYTTLAETHDRILATDVSGRWRFGWTGEESAVPDWDTSYAEARRHLLEAFASTYSLSLQQTMFQMGTRIVEHRPEIDEVRFSLPNKHHFLVDLEPFGLKNDNEVYFAADRPYGLIEATILREGREAGIPADLSNL